jgi:predicted acetyltransferase
VKTEYRIARAEDFAALSRMLELYQYELSDIWDQDLDENGEFGYDLANYINATNFFAHVALVDQRFAGFALVAPAIVTQKDGFWMEQFFVMKKFRHAGLGTELALHVFRSHPGPWEVGQMSANIPAQAFWRKVIARATHGIFSEVVVTQGWWQGVVQRFNYKATA